MKSTTVDYKKKFLGIKHVAKKGYEVLCDDIRELVEERLTCDLLNKFKEYSKTRREDIQALIELRGFDSLDLLDEEKEEITLRIIEDDIKKLLSQKGRVEEHLELKKINQCERITNGIEFSPYFKLFGSPEKLEDFENTANQLITLCDEELRTVLNTTVEVIKENWSDIEPHQPIPKRDYYLVLIEKKVNPILDEWVKKHFGT
jgi:hypothetical protein